MWIAAKNGNVFEVPDDQAESLVAQGHKSFDNEKDARKNKMDPTKAADESADADSQS